MTGEVDGQLDIQPSGSKTAMRLQASTTVEQYNDGAPERSNRVGVKFARESWNCGITNIWKADSDGPSHRKYDKGSEQEAEIACEVSKKF